MRLFVDFYGHFFTPLNLKVVNYIVPNFWGTFLSTYCILVMLELVGFTLTHEVLPSVVKPVIPIVSTETIM